MNGLGMLLAIAIALMLGDRLRQINWKTAKPLYMVMYVSYMLWTLGLLYDAATGGLESYQLIGMVATLAWLRITKPSWTGGAPEAALSSPAPLMADGHREIARNAADR